MPLTPFPELRRFFGDCFSESDPERDVETAGAFAKALPDEKLRRIVDQGRALLARAELSLESIGTEANRWFATEDEAKQWLASVLEQLGASQSDAGAITVKDSNGTPLAEGDAVTVIKDLKVRGGSSDLKRGTLIKKIHLVDDPEVIECRVDGSTLVLKTCFLRKA